MKFDFFSDRGNPTGEGTTLSVTLTCDAVVSVVGTALVISDGPDTIMVQMGVVQLMRLGAGISDVLDGPDL